MKIVQQLQPSDYATRKQFAKWFFETMADHVENVLWTDEAYFHFDGIVHTRNSYVWVNYNPHVIKEKPIHPPKICLWVGFSGKIIIPPFIIKMSHWMVTNILKF